MSRSQESLGVQLAEVEDVVKVVAVRMRDYRIVEPLDAKVIL
jgi:hypothetical protein